MSIIISSRSDRKHRITHTCTGQQEDNVKKINKFRMRHVFPVKKQTQITPHVFCTGIRVETLFTFANTFMSSTFRLRRMHIGTSLTSVGGNSRPRAHTVDAFVASDARPSRDRNVKRSWP